MSNFAPEETGRKEGRNALITLPGGSVFFVFCLGETSCGEKHLDVHFLLGREILSAVIESNGV